MSANSPVLKILLEEKFLLVRYDYMQAVIVGYELQENLIIYGRTPGWLFSKRAVSPFEKSASASEICRAIVSELYPATISLGETVSGNSIDVKYEEITRLDKCIEEILKNAGLGWRLRFDARAKQWIFDIYDKSDRGICLGEGYKNAYDTRICSDILDYAVAAVYTSENGVIRTKTGDMTCFEEICESQDKLGKVKNECSLMLKTDVNLGEDVRIKIVRGDNRITLKKRVDSLETNIKNGIKTVSPILV